MAADKLQEIFDQSRMINPFERNDFWKTAACDTCFISVQSVDAILKNFVV